jgi:hypothetical protein
MPLAGIVEGHPCILAHRCLTEEKLPHNACPASNPITSGYPALITRLDKSGPLVHIGIGFALVLTVGFLTVMFSFLGTLGAGALLGMMLGADGQWKWRSVSASLVFPAVMLGYSCFLKTDFASRQTLLLSLFSFGIFWLTYLCTFAVVRLEKSNKAETHELEPRITPPQETIEAAVQTVDDPELTNLQGSWECTTVSGDPYSNRKRIEVELNGITLSTFDHLGRALFYSKGSLLLERMGPYRLLKLENSSLAWLYRVEAETLWIASNFEAPAAHPNPSMETFVRLKTIAPPVGGPAKAA